MSRGTDAREVLDELERSLDRDDGRAGKVPRPAGGPKAGPPAKVP